MVSRSEAWLADDLAKRSRWQRGNEVRPADVQPDNTRTPTAAAAADGTIAAGELPPIEFSLAAPVKYTPRKSQRPPQPLERDILSAALQLLNLHPKIAWAKRMNVGMFKVQDSSGERWVRAAFKGCSDILGQLRDGRLLAVETKRPGEQPTPEQQAFIEHVRQHHGVAFVARSVDDVQLALANI